jgi:predicted anti-sigma-YlaC factor YlaD
MQIFTQTKHISEEAMGLHAMNDLPKSRHSRVDEHLSCCNRCRREFRKVQEFIAVLRMAAKADASAPQHHSCTNTRTSRVHYWTKSNAIN